MRLIFGEQTSRILEPSPQGLISSNVYGTRLRGRTFRLISHRHGRIGGDGLNL